MAKEIWIIANKSGRNISISDLPKAPSLGPKTSYNLLDYHTKSEIDRSVVLASLLNTNKVSIVKTASSPTSDKIKLPEEEDIKPFPAAAPSSRATEQSTTLIETITANDTITRVFVDLDIPTAKAVSEVTTGHGNVLWITIQRDANDVADTYAGDVNIIQITPYYCQWSNGASPSLLTV